MNLLRGAGWELLNLIESRCFDRLNFIYSANTKSYSILCENGEQVSVAHEDRYGIGQQE
jgi:hypothetical protein